MSNHSRRGKRAEEALLRKQLKEEKAEKVLGWFDHAVGFLLLLGPIYVVSLILCIWALITFPIYLILILLMLWVIL